MRGSHCLNVIDCSTLPDGGSYLVMEYVPGRSLARMIADVKSDNFLVESVDGHDHVT